MNELLALTDAAGARKAAALVGSEQEVLLEEDKGGGLLRGKTRGGARLRLAAPNLLIGQIVKVRVTGAHSRELHGELSS